MNEEVIGYLDEIIGLLHGIPGTDTVLRKAMEFRLYLAGAEAAAPAPETSPPAA